MLISTYESVNNFAPEVIAHIVHDKTDAKPVGDGTCIFDAAETAAGLITDPDSLIIK